MALQNEKLLEHFFDTRHGKSSLKKKVYGVSDWRDELKTEVSLDRSREEQQLQDLQTHQRSSHLRSTIRNADPKTVRIRQELARPSKVSATDAAEHRSAHHRAALQQEHRGLPRQAQRTAEENSPSRLQESHQQQVAVPHQNQPQGPPTLQSAATAEAGPLAQDLRNWVDQPAALGQRAGPDALFLPPAETRPRVADRTRGRPRTPNPKPAPRSHLRGPAAAASGYPREAAQARQKLHLCAGLPGLPRESAEELRPLHGEDQEQGERLRGPARRLPRPAPPERLLPRGHPRVRAEPARIRSSPSPRATSTSTSKPRPQPARLAPTQSEKPATRGRSSKSTERPCSCRT